MKFRITLVMIALMCFVLCAGLSQTLSRERRSDTVELVVGVSSPSPLLVFTTVVLGGFRGIIADLLWLRATGLQDHGRYVELVQLSDWITKFEPRATQAWAFHAWNMAYNVSVMMPSPEEKWRWVKNGIALLRDQGILYNASDPDLYFELALLYQHKIGLDSDESHEFYKRELARDVQSILGPSGSVAGLTDEAGQALWSRYRLELDYIAGLEDRYGRFDWRLPESHAIYWAQRGIDVAPDHIHRRNHHIVVAALAKLFFEGTLTWNAQEGTFTRTPRLDMLEVTIEAYQDMMRVQAYAEVTEALREFIDAAIPVLDEEGPTRQAESMRAVLRLMPPAPEL